MAQANLTENLSDVVTKAFKKTEMFEKILKFEFYIGSFVLISSIMGITCIYMNYNNNSNMDKIKHQINESESMLKSNFEMNRKQSLMQYEILQSEILMLNKKLSELAEYKQNILREIEELNLNKKTDEYMVCNRISTSTSMSSFSPIKITNTIFEDVREHDYDELLHECYDSIPLNNLKKNTGLSWIFK